MNSDTQRIRPVDGDLSTHQAYQARYGWREPVSAADRNERQTRRLLWWCLGAFAATVAGLLSLQGCR
jgi:hypothetical protein